MTTDALTQLLYEAKALQQGSVIEVHTTENEAFNSHVQHLKVSYATHHLPITRQQQIQGERIA